MTEHAWIHEQIAAFLADGLDAAENERFRTHVRECGECAAAVEAARAFDAGLANLFASARPGPMLEDRTVRALRTPKTLPAPYRGVWRRRVVTGLAASLAFGGLTAGGAFLVDNGGLPMPGEGFAWTQSKASSSIAEAVVDKVEEEKKFDLTNTDKGLDSELKTTLAKERVDDFTVDRVVVPDAPVGNDAPVERNEANQALRGFAKGKLGVEGTNTRWNESLSFGYNGSTPPTNYGLSGTQPAGAPANGRGDGTNWHFDPKAYYAQPVPVAAGKPVTSSGPAPSSGPVAAGGMAAGVTPLFAKPADGPTSAMRGDARWGAALGRPTDATGAAGRVVVAQAEPVATDTQPVRKVILRSGEIEFEVDSFDPAVATVTQLVAKIKGGYVGTVNSEKLVNGKVKGAIVVRVPPDALDGLVLDLRKEIGKAGELKGQKIGSSDVTKQYTDLESRLKAARAMEQRLLAIIKDGKGEIKALLEAEKELGVWRTKIEEYEGEKRYYDNLAALSTLTVTLAEKDIRVAAGITEREKVQAGVEVEDVDAAFRAALALVAEAKGRVTKSELKQLAAGQFNALVHFEVSPDAAGPLRDRLKQLGRVARLEIDRVQTADGGPPVKDAKVTRGDTTFEVQFYNLANVAPRETAVVQVATGDVTATFRTLRDVVEKAKGRVVVAQVSDGERQNVSAQFDFEVKRTEEATITAALAAAGDVTSKTVSRAPESDSVTDTKVAFRTTLVNAARQRPRETVTLTVEVPDVEGAAAVLTAAVTDAKGRVVDSQVSHDRTGKTTAKLVYDVPLPVAAAVVEKAKAAGPVRVLQSNRDPAATDGKFATGRVEVTLSDTDPIVSKDDGVWPPIRKGLSYSASALLGSLTWLVIGLCVVLPWVVLIYLIARIMRRFVRAMPPPVVPPAA